MTDRDLAAIHRERLRDLAHDYADERHRDGSTVAGRVEAFSHMWTYVSTLLAEAERRGAEKGWDEGQTSLMRDFLKPLNRRGMRDVMPNPYRAGADQ